jgi:glutamate/tyrosine decarboxylase-like PLP-dependent enzyme
VVLDPHKWLFQPYEIGCVLVRDRHWLHETFHIMPEYLRDLEGGQGEVNFCDLGIQLSRSFRALKLWMSLKTFGRAAFQGALERGLGLAETAEAMVRSLPDWEVVTPAQLGVVTFRFAPQGVPAEVLNLMNRQLVEEMIADGSAMISSTMLRGKVVLRMCTINPRTGDRDVRDTLRRLDSLGQGLYDRR